MGKAAVIAGIDEAGRGAVAGPVVAGACVLPASKTIHPLVRDSKQLTPQERTEAYAWITEHCHFGCGSVDAHVIDEIGILAATEQAMQAAVAALATGIKPTYLLVDGRDKFWFDYPHSSVIRGDETEPCIAAASIVAKVTRDQAMCAYASEFPLYDFAEHKGYGTPGHLRTIAKHGVCPLHRETFLTKHSSVATA